MYLLAWVEGYECGDGPCMTRHTLLNELMGIMQ
jgi:hypothetical protein